MIRLLVSYVRGFIRHADLVCYPSGISVSARSFHRHPVSDIHHPGQLRLVQVRTVQLTTLEVENRGTSVLIRPNCILIYIYKK